MDHRIEQLIGILQENGWELLGPADVSTDWWFQDIIHFASTWHPVGKNLYLTLLTDPQITDRKEVWNIGFSTEIPPDKHFTYLSHITLNDIKRTNLKDFTTSINKAILI